MKGIMKVRTMKDVDEGQNYKAYIMKGKTLKDVE